MRPFDRSRRQSRSVALLPNDLITRQYTGVKRTLPPSLPRQNRAISGALGGGELDIAGVVGREQLLHRIDPSLLY